MIAEINYINIREVLSRLLKHPLLQDITIEQAVSYTIDFIGIFGMPKLYQEKEVELHIDEYRTKLPCDLISINMVKDKKSGICLKSMTDVFKPDENRSYTFKTQGQVLFTSFKEGDVIISYKAIPIDDDGFPLLIDNPVFLKCLEAYIKKEVFGILFDLNKINGNVLNNAQQNYAWLAGQLQSEFTIPDVNEMESIKSMWTSMVQKNNYFYDGFKQLGNSKNIKVK